MNLYYELLQYPVFSMKEVNALYSSERTARAALGKLLKENMVLKIRNGLYTCVSGENGGPVANRFQVASAITPSSYVSHHTAFEYYGTVDQVFYEVYVGSETRFHDFEFDGYTYHYVVFCKPFLEKVAKIFWTKLHVHFGQSCKGFPAPFRHRKIHCRLATIIKGK